LLTKIISIGMIPFYALILTFMVHFGNATAIMFAIIILGSVATTTVYGAFRGSKLCLVPFVFLQVCQGYINNLALSVVLPILTILSNL
uniref:MATE family efflux transporter n=1 Tax=Heligmosomoides polygyrus TaxID=6339 RepID=A0A183GNM9_HELPZ